MWMENNHDQIKHMWIEKNHDKGKHILVVPLKTTSPKFKEKHTHF
jgi:hypothetical protein